MNWHVGGLLHGFYGSVRTCKPLLVQYILITRPCLRGSFLTDDSQRANKIDPEMHMNIAFLLNHS